MIASRLSTSRMNAQVIVTITQFTDASLRTKVPHFIVVLIRYVKHFDSANEVFKHASSALFNLTKLLLTMAAVVHVFPLHWYQVLSTRMPSSKTENSQQRDKVAEARLQPHRSHAVPLKNRAVELLEVPDGIKVANRPAINLVTNYGQRTLVQRASRLYRHVYRNADTCSTDQYAACAVRSKSFHVSCFVR